MVVSDWLPVRIIIFIYSPGNIRVAYRDEILYKMRLNFPQKTSFTLSATDNQNIKQ